MASTSEARLVYREILRALRRHVSIIPGNNQFLEFVGSQFRRQDLGADEVTKALAAGREWATLVRSIHAHKTLLHSYNIDIDREAELRERLQNTANRVGLQLTPERE